MTMAWLVQQRTGNSGWVDAIWSLGTASVACAAMVIAAQRAGQGWQPRTLMVIGLVAFWGVRLGSHIVSRAVRGGDDPRYAALAAVWGESFRKRMFWFLQAQAVAGFGLVVSTLAAVASPSPFPNVWDMIAIVTAVVAIGGEALADNQLKRCRHNGVKICEVGLWSWSRHPNYFFEFLFWCALPIFAIASGASWILIALATLAPAMMYWLLAHVSGVPPLEMHMLKSRGTAFVDYQRRVSEFFPMPPSKS
ncbi:MAG: DUF1295 domain-containing protein [Beijerinckiaceae bacterium]